MTTSQKGIDLIKSFEGCRLKSYQDVAGVWTVGWGHTRGAHLGQVITQEQADTLLRQDLAVIEGVLNIAITAPVNQNQFDACISLAFNVGPGNFTRSTLLKLLNAGDYGKLISLPSGEVAYDGAAGEFLKWNMAGGKPVAGLTRRRLAEQALFLEPANA